LQLSERGTRNFGVEFRQTAANFQQKIVRILILPLTLQKMGVFKHTFCILTFEPKNFSTSFQQPKMWGPFDPLLLSGHDATAIQENLKLHDDR